MKFSTLEKILQTFKAAKSYFFAKVCLRFDDLFRFLKFQTSRRSCVENSPDVEKKASDSVSLESIIFRVKFCFLNQFFMIDKLIELLEIVQI